MTAEDLGKFGLEAVMVGLVATSLSFFTVLFLLTSKRVGLLFQVERARLLNWRIVQSRVCASTSVRASIGLRVHRALAGTHHCECNTDRCTLPRR